MILTNLSSEIGKVWLVFNVSDHQDLIGYAINTDSKKPVFYLQSQSLLKDLLVDILPIYASTSLNIETTPSAAAIPVNIAGPVLEAAISSQHFTFCFSPEIQRLHIICKDPSGIINELALKWLEYVEVDYISLKDESGLKKTKTDSYATGTVGCYLKKNVDKAEAILTARHVIKAHKKMHLDSDTDVIFEEQTLFEGDIAMCKLHPLFASIPQFNQFGIDKFSIPATLTKYGARSEKTITLHNIRAGYTGWLKCGEAEQFVNGSLHLGAYTGGGNGSLPGDSGGPWYHNDTLYGIHKAYVEFYRSNREDDRIHSETDKKECWYVCTAFRKNDMEWLNEFTLV